MEWVLAEAETPQNGGVQDVYAYLTKSWLPLVSRGNYFVYLPNVEVRPDLEGPAAPDHQVKDINGKIYPHSKTTRRDVPAFNYQEKGTTAYGLDLFLRKGFALVGSDDGKHPAILLTLLPSANVQCMDPGGDGRNPYSWINERLSDLKAYAKSLKLDPQRQQGLDNEIANIEKHIMSWYKTGSAPDAPAPHVMPDGAENPQIAKENEERRLQRILHLINIEVPRAIAHFTTPQIAGKFRMKNQFLGKNPPLTDEMKGHREVGVDAMSHTCPVSKSEWIVIFNPRAIRKVDSVMLNGNFRGLNRLRDNPDKVVTKSAGTRQYEAMNEKIQNDLQAVSHVLDAMLGDEIYFTGSDKMLDRKKRVLKYIQSAGNIAISLAKSQPNEAEELADRFQHLLNQIEPQIHQAELDAEQMEEHPDEKPQGMSVEDMKAEAQHWHEIETAFLNAITGIKKAAG